jgi:hypothetical protein
VGVYIAANEKKNVPSKAGMEGFSKRHSWGI